MMGCWKCSRILFLFVSGQVATVQAHLLHLYQLTLRKKRKACTCVSVVKYLPGLLRHPQHSLMAVRKKIFPPLPIHCPPSPATPRWQLALTPVLEAFWVREPERCFEIRARATMTVSRPPSYPSLRMLRLRQSQTPQRAWSLKRQLTRLTCSPWTDPGRIIFSGGGSRI